MKGIDPQASFVAIDFETANHRLNSACVHGITWERVSGARPFGEVWPALAALLAGAEFVAAHNADFDRGVLHACCRAAGVRPPGLPFLCLARRVWEQGLFPGIGAAAQLQTSGSKKLWI